MSNEVKAAVLVKTGVAEEAFEIRTVIRPEPASHEILIKVEAFGLNYADVMARNGIYADAPPLPSILGYEVVGTVEKIGTGISDFGVGQRVLAFTRFGAYAQYAVANELAAVVIPDTVPADHATALATQYCTAVYCAEWMANIRKTDTLLIHAAAGGVGNALIQIGKNKGCKIAATAGSPEKIAYLNNLGVDLAINYRKDRFTDKITSELGRKAIDVAFDPIGGKNFKLNRSLLEKGGRLVMYGISTFSGKKGTMLNKLKLALDFGFMHPFEFLVKSQTIIGVNMLHIADKKPAIIRSLLLETTKGYSEGTYQPKIGWYGPVEKLAEAHAFLESRNSIGKIAVHW